MCVHSRMQLNNHQIALMETLQASLFKKLCRKTSRSNTKAMDELKVELLPYLPPKKSKGKGDEPEEVWQQGVLSSCTYFYI